MNVDSAKVWALDRTGQGLSIIASVMECRFPVAT
jgi:hypothetical protein